MLFTLIKGDLVKILRLSDRRPFETRLEKIVGSIGRVTSTGLLILEGGEALEFVYVKIMNMEVVLDMPCVEKMETSIGRRHAS